MLVGSVVGGMDRHAIGGLAFRLQQHIEILKHCVPCTIRTRNPRRLLRSTALRRAVGLRPRSGSRRLSAFWNRQLCIAGQRQRFPLTRVLKPDAPGGNVPAHVAHTTRGTARTFDRTHPLRARQTVKGNPLRMRADRTERRDSAKEHPERGRVERAIERCDLHSDVQGQLRLSNAVMARNAR